jgi:uncharacterized damage-inducible protein DinB
MTRYSLAIELTPPALRRIIDCVQPARYTERLSDDRFTLVEMVAHVSDMEDVFLERMRVAWKNPGAPIELVNEDTRAVEKHYGDRSVQHELDVFENRRRDTVDFIRSLSPEELTHHVMHPEFGKMTIEDLTHFLLGHDIYHLQQATEYLR